MYQLVHYSYHNVPLGELVGTLWKIIYQLIHYGNIIAFQNQSYLQIRLEKCLISHQYNVTKGILTLIVLGDRMLQSVGVGSIVPAGFSTSFNIVLI